MILRFDVTILQQIEGNPPRKEKRVGAARLSQNEISAGEFFPCERESEMDL
jgi:hypothetical protein